MSCDNCNDGTVKIVCARCGGKVQEVWCEKCRAYHPLIEPTIDELVVARIKLGQAQREFNMAVGRMRDENRRLRERLES